MASAFVGVDAWIIQDGNYGDFRVGQATTFALEFYPHQIQSSEARAQSMQRVNSCRYRICGRVEFAGKSVWVVNFGLMAYQHREAPRFAAKGSWVEGEFGIGIDPFFYYRELHARPGMPELRYSWRIAEINLETTPWLHKANPPGPALLTRDESQQSFIAVAETDAWNDDDRRAHYVLECEKLS